MNGTMHNNPFVLKLLAEELGRLLAGQRLVSCVSTSTKELYLHFSKDFVLNVVLEKNDTFFLIGDADRYPKKNVLHQFKGVCGNEVKGVDHHFPDRSFSISFQSGASLRFLCYGRNNDVIQMDEMLVVDQFKPKLDYTDFRSLQTIVLEATEAEFIELNRFMTPELLDKLKRGGFFAANKTQKENLWAEFVSDLSNPPVFIRRAGNITTLSLLESDDQTERFESVLEAQHYVGKKLLKQLRFTLLFKQCEVALQKEIKQLNKRLKSAELSLKQRDAGGLYKEMADVLMANIHLIPKGSVTARLTNFYTEKEIDIKLNPEQSIQKNAERFYRKSKNAHLEQANASSLMDQWKGRLNSVEGMLYDLSNAKEYSDLLNIQNQLMTPNTKEKVVSVPYKTFEHSGFQIWVGKSAKANDELLKLAGKHDLWLHAREVAGSHVLIRNPNQIAIPTPVLEYAASLAAGHSKNQHEQLAAVIYTPVKYVRKFKRAHEGQVIVEREEVILIEPAKN